MASFEFTSPEGKKYTVEGPPGATQEQAFQMLQTQLAPAQAPAQATPTDRDRLLASAPMRLAKGMKDPIDGAAQLVQRALPNGVVNAVNKAADAIGGEGTFLGDVFGIKGATPEKLSADIKDSNAEYENARRITTPKTLTSYITGQKDEPGFDAMRLAGNVLSPVNAAVGRVLPVTAIGNTKTVLAAKGAVAGAAGAATQPVMGETDNYWREKAGQVGAGAAGGAVLTPVLSRAAESVARMVRERLGTGTISKTPEAIQMEITASLKRDDIDAGQIPKMVMDKLTTEVQQAMTTGQQVNAPALLRKLDFDRVGVKPLLGQLTRDPTQFTREVDLRGVQGVGTPIANRLNEQQGTIAARFRQATAGAQNPYEAGQTLIDKLQGKDRELSAGVRAGYQAFKDATGKDIEVPLDGLRKGYQETLLDFADSIPSAVRSRLDALTNDPAAKLSIEDAERLIKTINKNYNPADRAQAKALDELRGHVQNAILDVTGDGAGMEAATLANLARDTARQRFSAIDSAPAFKAAINGAEPDDFVRKFVINGKVRELNRLAELAGPDGQRAMGQQMLKYLEKKAFGTNVAGDGSGSQASFNRELQSIGKNKLEALLGPEQADDLFAVGRVMAYIQQQPAGSAVNNSNTGAAVASLLGKIGGKIQGAPYIHDFIVKPILGLQERSAVTNALTAQLPKEAAQLDPQTINRLARLMGPVPQTAGTALGYSVR